MARLHIACLAALIAAAGLPATALAEQLPWGQSQPPQVLTPGSGGDYQPYGSDQGNAYQPEPYSPAPAGQAQPYAQSPGYDNPIQSPEEPGQYGQDSYVDQGGYAAPQGQPRLRQRTHSNDQPGDYGTAYDPDGAAQPPEQVPPRYAGQDPANTFEPGEITAAGHRFFGRITSGLASVIEYAFQNNGRPNGYILGEEGGGAFVAGLRYGEGTLYTKNAGERKVFWQGPSIGYDFGAEGSKTMILVYNMYSPEDVFYDYAGVGGQAYVVGGVGITYLTSGHVTMAPIRSGLGLRLGANVGYLKFTRAPTWNPF